MRYPIFRILAILIFFCVQVSKVYSKDTIPNLIPNSSFESLSNIPIGWYYKGEHFTRVMKFWSSPTGSSPDAYVPGVKVPMSWSEKGFGKQKPHKGNGMAGITVYGCEDGKPHCREYLQIQITEPLVPGQKYKFDMWVQPLMKAVQVNNIGVAFETEKIELAEDKPLSISPWFQSKEILGSFPSKWVKYEHTFVAKQRAEYLIIGNFLEDNKANLILSKGEGSLNYGYYYIDDVSLLKLEPYLPVPEEPDGITPFLPSIGKTFRLENIYFDFDKDELHPRSLKELNKLTWILKKYSKIKIEIQGHTDSVSNSSYNLVLSNRRAKTVTDYLIKRGISKNRLTWVGLGETIPIADNNTSQGRRKNRRVEFTIKAM
jgi:OmpA-OmpF porin, OOP family